MASVLPFIAAGVGYLLHYAIYGLNTFIELVANMPFAITGDLQISFPQLICLYVFIVAISWWLLYKRKAGVSLALGFYPAFYSIQYCRCMECAASEKLIVYNIPKHSAIDVMVGTKYIFKGDSVLQQDDLLQQYHLQPSRSLHRVNISNNTGKSPGEKNFFRFGNTSFLLIDQQYNLKNITTQNAG